MVKLKKGFAYQFFSRCRSDSDLGSVGSSQPTCAPGAGGKKPCTKSSVNRSFDRADIQVALSCIPYLDDAQRFFNALTIHP